MINTTMKKLLMLSLIPSSIAFSSYSIPRETVCMANNIYFEARGESSQGKLAVAYVTHNRKKSKKFPKDICSVVQQHAQFSWTLTHKLVKKMSSKEWTESFKIASLYQKYKDPTNGSLYYHSKKVHPKWANKLKRTKNIGSHIFYK